MIHTRSRASRAGSSGLSSDRIASLGPPFAQAGQDEGVGDLVGDDGRARALRGSALRRSSSSSRPAPSARRAASSSSVTAALLSRPAEPCRKSPTKASERRSMVNGFFTMTVIITAARGSYLRGDMDMEIILAALAGRQNGPADDRPQHARAAGARRGAAAAHRAGRDAPRRPAVRRASSSSMLDLARSPPSAAPPATRPIRPASSPA